MQFLLMSLFAAVIVAADQITKYMTVVNLELYERIPVIPGVVGLTRVHNSGAAFSSFQGMQWLFALIFVIMTVGILYEYFKNPLPFTKSERWAIAAIYGGGLGNMIDRLRFGYVIDMVETQFMTFPIFNVADCFITCGCIFLMAHILLCNKEFWKEEKQ